eukprot:CAMPEP_0171253470 /NCGR_PEP_ID=MMETSP0790-20130122/51722_1 /TAXON_ID=2925 /ORGANISM="Alexandrium catenella, Strain OF101" /LENGTH=229 /DNA_ID=CAMNT_0011721301 /DNA_START=84 /DNA_END=770 /DNA_ORIENTATION=-
MSEPWEAGARHAPAPHTLHLWNNDGAVLLPASSRGSDPPRLPRGSVGLPLRDALVREVGVGDVQLELLDDLDGKVRTVPIDHDPVAGLALPMAGPVPPGASVEDPTHHPLGAEVDDLRELPQLLFVLILVHEVRRNLVAASLVVVPAALVRDAYRHLGPDAVADPVVGLLELGIRRRRHRAQNVRLPQQPRAGEHVRGRRQERRRRDRASARAAPHGVDRHREVVGSDG